MKRIMTAAAIAILFAAAPALAQDVTKPGQEQSVIDQGREALTPQPSAPEQYGQQQGQTELRPSDCLPNDVRPECQTAALPESAPPQEQMGATPEQPSTAPQTERSGESESGTMETSPKE